MESVAESVRDPAWWFSVFFAGIVVSILAGFLKDAIGGLIANLSSRLRARRAAKLARRAQLFDALATNETFLILSMIRLMGLMTISFMLLAMYAFLPEFLEVKEILCQVAPAASVCKTFSPLISKLYIVCLGSLAIGFNYAAASRLSLVMKGLKQFRIKNKLPRVF